MTTNCYCTLADLKTRLVIPDATDDAQLKAIIESASRLVDTYCGRKFYVETRTRYLTAGSPYLLEVPDLLSVTTLSTDSDLDRTYEETWAATDYDLLPFNAAYESPPRPYNSIATSPLGDYSFPIGTRGVSVLGKWGFYEVLASIDTLGAAIASTTATTFTATSGTGYGAGQTIIVDSEQMHVQSVNGATVTVSRAANGTTAATHLIAAPVSAYTYPMVSEAVLLQCSRLFARRNAPFGITGNAEMGTLLVVPKMDSDVAAMLNPLRSWSGF
jgi:hypothetical protein